MKIKTFMLLLMLSAGACTVPPHSSGNQDTQQWQQTIQQLNTLLKERKHQAAIDEGKQKISELLAVADHTEAKVQWSNMPGRWSTSSISVIWAASNFVPV